GCGRGALGLRSGRRVPVGSGAPCASRAARGPQHERSGAAMISLAVFKRLVDVYGANLARWPDSFRMAARRLQTRTPEAAQHWREAQHLARRLDQFEPQYSLGALARVRAAILDATLRPAPRPVMARMLFAPLVSEAAVFTTIAVVGLGIGLFLME